MGTKQTGYDFWNNILKSPQYVAAPMVDMSELSFRMLCRQYKAQLCFSPMLHSQQFLQDSLYRSDTFSTCAEDKPLIVQFCSNDPDNFVNAAYMVSSQCSAIDLNLGCPQAIARKGHYGAFLQDDWDLIRAIVRKASSDLPVPITCKMRILPGDLRNSVQYAKMLEDSGCSVITVHGRTREQKGHAIGLASWEAIKAIKSNVNIPIIANGNILSFRDVQECLKYTGADAVMSAEALLHNPALFSGKNLPVWNIVEEYLGCAEKYNTPIRYVRCHLFKILYLCIHQDNRIQEILADGKTFADFYAVCDLLKSLPKACSDDSKRQESADSVNDFCDLDCNVFEVSNCKVESKSDSPTLLLNKLNVHSGPTNVDQIDSKIPTVVQNLDDVSSHQDQFEDNLPIWLCHSRPRVADNESKTRGCYSKYFESSTQKINCAEELYMSKKKLRRERHHEKVLAAMKEKRKSQKMRRKQKLAEQPQVKIVKDTSEERIKITKKEKKLMIKERLLKAQGSSPKVCINLGFVSEMNKKELTRLSSQLRRIYGSNRHSSSPLHLYFCNFSASGSLYQICLVKNDGFSSYVVDMTEKAPEDIFKPEDLIYLSPDSENVLTSLERDKVYVIGGIVDGTARKCLSLNHAKEQNIQTARLPIPEYLVRCTQNPGTTVLTVNQVFDILLKYYETEDWLKALGSNVPPRKGYCAPQPTPQCSS